MESSTLVCNPINQKKFVSRSELARHEGTHTGNRPTFTCEFEDCRKSYVEWRSLKRHHTRVHKNEAPPGKRLRES